MPEPLGRGDIGERARTVSGMTTIWNRVTRYLHQAHRPNPNVWQEALFRRSANPSLANDVSQVFARQ